MNLTVSNETKQLGYRLKQIKDKKWQVTSSRGVVEGDLVYVWQVMNWDYEIANSEIRYAIDEMKKNNHQAAEFGIFGSFMFTTKD